MKLGPKILFLVPDDYASLQAKGVASMILERDENGFFEKVITVHPLGYKKQHIVLSERHIIYEFSLRHCFYPNKKGWLLLLLPWQFLRMVWQLAIMIRKEKIDLIRANDPYLMGLTAWILARLTKIPFCISLHCDYDLVFKLNPQKGFKKLLRVCTRWIPRVVLPKAQLILPIRHHLKKMVLKHVPEKRIRVIPHGIDFNFHPRSDLWALFGLTSDKKMISFVGRLSRNNYCYDILKIIEKLSMIRSDFIFILVGEGELASEIKVWVEAHPQLNANVRLLGFQPNDVARSLRSISTAVFIPIGGFSLIEAAAAGCPLIAYDVEWVSEFVETNINGFLVKEHDINGVVNAICYLFDHPKEAMLMGENAKNKAYRDHDIVKTSYLKQSYYLELLENRALA